MRYPEIGVEVLYKDIKLQFLTAFAPDQEDITELCTFECDFNAYLNKFIVIEECECEEEFHLRGFNDIISLNNYVYDSVLHPEYHDNIPNITRRYIMKHLSENIYVEIIPKISVV